MKEKLDRAGRWVADLYISTLAIAVLVFPFIFCGGLILLSAWLSDRAGFSHLVGLVGLGVFVLFWFFALLVFSAFEWPHISPHVDKALDALRLRDSA
jgi:hypothetical protein